jgi:hypothetical protein
VIFPKVVASNQVFRPLFANVVLTLLQHIPLVWYITFEDSEPADLNNRIGASRIIRVQ